MDTLYDEDAMVKKIIFYIGLSISFIDARVLPCIRHTHYVQSGYLPHIVQFVDNFNAHEHQAHKILVIGHRLPEESDDVAKQRAIEAGNILLASGVPKEAIELKTSSETKGNFVDLSIMTDFFFTTH